jgi:MYXO-CTERM domain-containing protein
LVLWPALAGAHGGLPVSLRILRADGRLYVPVVFWGMWVGKEGEPWTWICEEAINGFRTRRYAVGSDGTTFYATDTRGLTRSTDRGCTWTPVAGELADKRVTEIETHASDPMTAWLTTASGAILQEDGGTTAPDNALFVTHDRGASWSRVPGLAGQNTRLLQGLRVSGNTLYVTSAAAEADPRPAIHRSDDGGAAFSTFQVSAMVDGVTPYALEVLAIDPRDARVVYLRAFATTPTSARQALLRSADGGATFSTLLVQDGVMTPSGLVKGIDGVAIDAKRALVYVASSQGFYSGSDPGGAPTVSLAKTSMLSQAQCVDVSGDTVLACSTNYMPDNAAIARSDDGAQSFRSILRYADTQGPVTYCPKGTPVADMCPLYWQMYGEQLGITFDGGVTPPPPPPGDCSCAISGRGAGVLDAGMLLAFVGLLFLRRRRV